MNLPLTFLWPQLLWLLLTVPLLVLAYWLLLRRKRQTALRYASLSLVKEAMGGRGWRRHVPPVLFLMALTAMLLAAARPLAVIVLPNSQQTIILAMDVSGSMRATDVEPNRLVAAQNAAKAFLTDLPRQVKVGIVAFAGSAQVVQQPTLNREDLAAAIDRFQLQRATAIGSAIVVSLAEIFPDAGIDLDEILHGQASHRGRALDPSPQNKPPPHQPVPPGSYRSAAIILLTDGQRTTGVDTLQAAQMAAERGVKIYTVGVGTVEGETIGFEGWSMRVRLDEETLKEVATRTHGEYFYAGTADNLRQVYQTLGTRLTLEKKETEISGLMALLGALLAMMSAGLSLWWFNRIA